MKYIYLFLLIISCLLIWRLIIYITRFFNTKTNYYLSLRDSELIKNPINKLDNTLNYLNLINTLIDNEISSVMKESIQLRHKYELLKFDDDLKTISINVYNALDKDIFLDNALTLTNEYIQAYIISASSKRFLNIINEHNTSIRFTS